MKADLWLPRQARDKRNGRFNDNGGSFRRVHSGFSLTEDCSVAVCMASSSTALPELVIGSTADWSPQTLTNMTEQIADWDPLGGREVTSSKSPAIFSHKNTIICQDRLGTNTRKSSRNKKQGRRFSFFSAGNFLGVGGWGDYRGHPHHSGWL
jgi:hypothetical protein